MKDVQTKLSEAVAIGVRSSGKDSTRRHRVEFYLGEVTRAKLEVQYYEEMLRVEEQKGGALARRYGWYDEGFEELQSRLRRMMLERQVHGLWQADKLQAGDEGDEASEEGVGQRTRVKDEDDGWSDFSPRGKGEKKAKTPKTPKTPVQFG